MLGTKSYYTNETTHITRSQEPWNDIGYSLDIPWNTIYTAGWMDATPAHADGKPWGTENQLVTRSDPEYFAPGNIVRSNVIPQINTNDPIYHFDRSKYTYTIY